MLPLTTPEKFQVLMKSKTTFLVWYSAAWCNPCQKMEKPRLEEAAAGLPFYYCDEVVNPDTIVKAGVRQFPTFVFYVGGVEVARRTHADTTKICQWIRKTCTYK